MWTKFNLIHFRVKKILFWSKFEEVKLLSDLKNRIPEVDKSDFMIIFEVDQNSLSHIWRKKNEEVDQNFSTYSIGSYKRCLSHLIVDQSFASDVRGNFYVVKIPFQNFRKSGPHLTRFDPFLMLFKRKRNSKLDFLNFNLVEIKIFEKLEIFSQRMFGLIHFNHFGIKIDDPGWSIVTGTWSNKVSD